MFTQAAGARYSSTVTNSANRANDRHPSVYHVLVYISRTRSTIVRCATYVERSNETDAKTNERAKRCHDIWHPS